MLLTWAGSMPGGPRAIVVDCASNGHTTPTEARNGTETVPNHGATGRGLDDHLTANRYAIKSASSCRESCFSSAFGHERQAGAPELVDVDAQDDSSRPSARRSVTLVAVSAAIMPVSGAAVGGERARS